MTMREMVRKYLSENGYDGLWCNLDCPCGCGIDDLFPCSAVNGDLCVAAKLGRDGYFYRGQGEEVSQAGNYHKDMEA